MKSQISDEKLDQILKKLVKDSALRPETADEIAASPNLWQGVRRQIAQQKTRRPRFWILAWQWRAAVFASLAFSFCAGLLLLLNSPQEDLTARGGANDAAAATTAPKTPEVKTAEPDKGGSAPVSGEENAPPAVKAKAVRPKRDIKPGLFAKSAKAKTTGKPLWPLTTGAREIKTDFIALAFAPVPESGQILKVKVPRAMMVSLGVSTKIENSSELVNAEVIVGDDGSARAIRFVQN